MMRSKVFNGHVSVVVPAYNAAETLDETLASLQAQTFPSWEAIIVDDGSTDSTAAIATCWAQQDCRFRLLRQANGGESAARNTGIRSARNDWLLFLDADDWVAPKYMERIMGQLTADPWLDAVVCGCVRVTPSGQFGPPALFEPSSLDNLFPEFARDCPFAIHNCLVQRSLVEAVGGFNTSLVTCADWDFWQRVTRAGARFGTVPEVLAFYRIRPGSASTKAERVLLDGLTVIRRGHARDPRVPNPDPNYAEGLPTEGLPEALFRHALWPASLLLAQGKDARSLLRFMGEERAPSLDPLLVAINLFESIPLAAGGTTQDWPELWPVVAKRLNAYLVALEAQSGALELAQRSAHHLERLILEVVDFKQPIILGSTYGVRIDVTHPIADVVVPRGVEQLGCVVEAAGHPIGSVQMPVLGNIVASQAIAESIVADLAWPLMRWYFHLSLPRGSPLKTRLYWLMQERRPLRMAIRLAGLAWPLIRWQFRDGLLWRNPWLLARLIWLILEMKPLRMAYQLVSSRPESRRNRLKEFLWEMARRVVREDGLLITTLTEGPGQTGPRRSAQYG